MEEKEWEATAGGGAVTVKISGKKEVLSVKLDPEVVDHDDIEMLEDLIAVSYTHLDVYKRQRHLCKTVHGGKDVHGL